MPNHFHTIIKINGPVGEYGYTPTSTSVDNRAYINTPNDRAYINTPLRSPKNNLGAIVRGFKSATTTKINTLFNTPGIPIWQRNYYEHIIREEDELYNIRQYILENPRSWDRDRNNPKNL